MAQTVRQIVLEAIIEKLKAIKFSNGYNREVPDSNVYAKRVVPTAVGVPSIMLVQGDEEVDPIALNGVYECDLRIGIGFIDSYFGDEPDMEVLEFMGDIQRAMGTEFTITCTSASSGTSSTQIVNMVETGNSINLSEALSGMILGQVGYSVRYRRHYLYPDKIQ